MTIRRIGITPVQPMSKISGIGRVSLRWFAGCGDGGVWVGDDGLRRHALDDEAHARRAADRAPRALRDVLGRGRRELMVLALGPDVDRAGSAGRDGHAHRAGPADEVADRVGLLALGATQRPEEQIRDPEANEAEAHPDRGGWSAVQVEDL